MADKVTTLTPQAISYIYDELRTLRQRQNALLSGGLNQSFPQGVLPTRWARTCTSPDYPTYPTTGNVVAVEFGEYDPSPLSPGSTATKTFTAISPQVVVLATGDNSPLPFEGQIVPVVWRNGKWWYLHPNFRRATADVSISAGSSGAVSLMDDTTDMGSRTAYYTWADSGGPTIDAGDEIFVAWFDAEQKWIILPPAGAGTSTTIPTAILFNGNAYNGDSSNKNRLKYYGVSHASNRSCYIHFINGWGDLSGTGVDVMATASSVGAGTHAYTDASFKLTQGGLYRFIVRLQNEDTTTLPAYTTNTLTTSNSGGHTHTVDVRQEHGFRSQILVQLQWRNAGGGAWQTTDFQMTANGSRVDFSTDAGAGDTPDEDTFEAVFWQNHNEADREYRIKVILGGDFDSATTFLQRDIYADSGLIAITRLADYATDQTLTP